jgi:hypothetical protein
MRIAKFFQSDSWNATIVASALAFTASGGLYVWQLSHRSLGWIHAQILELPDAEIEPWLQGLVESHDAAALKLVTQDLASSRAAVRRSARNVLQAEIARWPTLSVDVNSAHALVLVDSLRRLPRVPSNAETEEVTGLLYAWAMSDDCAAPLRERLAISLYGLPRRAPLMPTDDEELFSLRSMTSEPVAPTRPLVVPETATTAPVIQQMSAETPLPVVDEPPVRRLVAVPVALPALPAPRLLSPEVNQDAAPIPEDWDLAPRPIHAYELDGAGDEAPAPYEEASPIKHASPRELFQQLHSPDAKQAIAELHARGFDEEEIEIAQHLSSRNVVERRKWTEALPRIGKIDAQPWLIWMTEDRDASVRRTAVTLLATMKDAAAVTRLREIAARDPDPSLRRLAAEQSRRE